MSIPWKRSEYFKFYNIFCDASKAEIKCTVWGKTESSWNHTRLMKLSDNPMERSPGVSTYILDRMNIVQGWGPSAVLYEEDKISWNHTQLRKLCQSLRKESEEWVLNIIEEKNRRREHAVHAVHPPLISHLFPIPCLKINLVDYSIPLIVFILIICVSFRIKTNTILYYFCISG